MTKANVTKKANQILSRSQRSHAYRCGNFGLELDMYGGQTAWIKSVSGGHVSAEVARGEANNDEHTIRKVQKVTVAPIVFEQSIGAATPLYKWIQSSWQRKYSRCNGAIVHANARFDVEYRHEFFNALITEVTFPTLDAASHDLAYLTVKMQPETVDIQRVSKSEKLFGFEESAGPKEWGSSHFELRLFNGGRELDCTGVRKIDSFTLRQETREVNSGAQHFTEIEPTGLKFPDLSLSMPAGLAEDFVNWQDEFLMQGSNCRSNEMQGMIELLRPTHNKQKTLLTIALDGVGIQSLEFDKNDTSTDALQMCKVSLYVDTMTFIT